MSSSIVLPSGETTTLTKLNLGCGFDIKEGYLNVDLNDFHSPDIVANIIDMVGFPSGAFDEIYAKDVIEHFVWRDTPKALMEWNRLLKPDGKLFVGTSYLTGLARRVLDPAFADLDTQRLTVIHLYSMQMYEGDFHLTIFTERLLRWHLWVAGFEVEKMEIVGGWLIYAWAVKRRDLSGDHLINVGSDAEFVRSLYVNLLQREPEPEAVEPRVALLQAGSLTRQEFYRQVMVCPERMDLMSKAAPPFELLFDPY